MIKLETILKDLSLEEYRELLTRNWNCSLSLMENTEFLTEDYIVENARLAEIDADFIPAIISTAGKIGNSESFKRLFMHCHYLLFISQDVPDDIAKRIPDMKNVLNDEAFTCNLLLALSGIKISKKYFSSMDMPADVVSGAFRDISLWVSHNYRNSGCIGLSLKDLNWERCLMRGDLFRLGRLQFNMRPFLGEIIVFRNKNTNQVQALAQDGISINSSGRYDGVNGVFDNEAWTSDLTYYRKQVIGNPVSSDGYVSSENICLDLLEWDEVLTKNDPVLDIHIPAGENMTMEKCADSINYSIKFFAKYFPDKDYKGWACSCWFLDNQLEKILPESSNIIKFQRELYLYPVKAGGEESYRRIFGERGIKDGIENIPRKSSMQKAVASFLEQGGKLRSGGGFFLKEDMPWGRQHYYNEPMTGSRSLNEYPCSNAAKRRRGYFCSGKIYRKQANY